MAKSPPPNSYCIYQVIADFTNTEVILLEATTPDPDGDYRPIRRWTTHAGLPNRRPRQTILIKHWDGNYDAVDGNVASENWGTDQNPNYSFRPEEYEEDRWLSRNELEVDYCPWHPDPTIPNAPNPPRDPIDPMTLPVFGWMPPVNGTYLVRETMMIEGGRDHVRTMPDLRPGWPQGQVRWMDANWDDGPMDPAFVNGPLPFPPLVFPPVMARLPFTLACDGPPPTGTMEGV